MANNNLILIVAVVLGVFLLSGGITGNALISQKALGNIQTATAAANLPNQVNALNSRVSSLSSELRAFEVADASEHASLTYKIEKLGGEQGYWWQSYGCSCVCLDETPGGNLRPNVGRAWGKACMQDCAGASGGGAGSPGGVGTQSAACQNVCGTYCGAAKVASAACIKEC